MTLRKQSNDTTALFMARAEGDFTQNNPVPQAALGVIIGQWVGWRFDHAHDGFPIIEELMGEFVAIFAFRGSVYFAEFAQQFKQLLVSFA